jgi:predicted transcriptional regulator
VKEITKEIDGCIVTLKGWGFLTLINRKRDVIKWASENSNSVMELFDSISDKEVDHFLVATAIGEMMNILSEKVMVSAMLTLLKGVRIDGVEITTKEELDEFFSSRSTLFYKIAGFVLEVNYGDFLEMGRNWLKSVSSASKEENVG